MVTQHPLIQEQILSAVTDGSYDWPQVILDAVVLIGWISTGVICYR